MPESEQFQFVGGVLRTPKQGNARLCLPVKVPQFYHLTLDTTRKDESADPPIGIGAVMDGHQFFVELRLEHLTLGRFYQREITTPFVARRCPPDKPGPQGVAELFVGDVGVLFKAQPRSSSNG